MGCREVPDSMEEGGSTGRVAWLTPTAQWGTGKGDRSHGPITDARGYVPRPSACPPRSPLTTGGGGRPQDNTTTVTIHFFYFLFFIFYFLFFIFVAACCPNQRLSGIRNWALVLGRQAARPRRPCTDQMHLCEVSACLLEA
jgi:hypothetical protein